MPKILAAAQLHGGYAATGIVQDGEEEHLHRNA
jgi:hypothetical protein